MYTPIDLASGKFRKVKVSHASAGRLATAEFTNPNITDIASTSYYIPGFHTGPDASSIHINVLHPISVTRLGEGGHVASTATNPSSPWQNTIDGDDNYCWVEIDPEGSTSIGGH